MEHEEENLSDASLIEDDEEDESEAEIDMLQSAAMQQQQPIMDQDEQLFHGFFDHEIGDEKPANQIVDNDDNEFDLSAPFPSDMKDCLGWYSGQLPYYEVKMAPAASTPTTGFEEDTRKVKPLKIKNIGNAGGFSTPSPLLQRESREWKPSSQFFKPLIAGWVREVIYERNEDGTLYAKAKEVIYHAPMIAAGSKAGSRTFKSQAELRPYRKL